MPGAFRVIVGVPTHGMRVCQPPKEFRQLLVRLWSNHKVPVIGHQTIRKNRQRNSSDGFDKHSIECFVVRRLFKQCQSRHSSVEHMEAHSSRAFPTTSWHCPSVTKQNHRVKQNNELRPLFPSRWVPLACLSPTRRLRSKVCAIKRSATIVLGLPGTDERQSNFRSHVWKSAALARAALSDAARPLER